MSPRVLNKRTGSIPPEAVYVGRPSKWGNPFKVGHCYRSSGGEDSKPLTREEVVSFYELWLTHHPELVIAARIELAGKDLVCWCAKPPCHAYLLLELANKGEKHD